MSEFAYFFRGREASASPEQMQQAMQKWMDWFKELGEKGHVKDPGHPLEVRQGREGQPKTVTDGPYAETKDVVGGYTLVEAKDLKQAAELSKGCPIFEVGRCRWKSGQSCRLKCRWSRAIICSGAKRGEWSPR